MHTFADDQIDSDIIFDDPYVDNNSGQAEHDTNAHDHSLHDFESLIINVQVEAEKQWKMNIELKRQQALLQRELETCKERVKEFENKPEQALGYKEAYEKLQNKMNFEMEQLFNEKEKIREELLKTQDETLKIKPETNLYKKAFKERENRRSTGDVRNFCVNGTKSRSKHKKMKLFKMKLFDFLEASLEREIRDCVLISVEQHKNEMLMFEMEKISNESKDIQVNLLKRIKILENNFQRSQARCIDFELKLQLQKEEIAYDISWNSQMA
ncbi:hypothetical protein Tco_1071260 [Tanacetum coccineum]